MFSSSRCSSVTVTSGHSHPRGRWMPNVVLLPMCRSYGLTCCTLTSQMRVLALTAVPRSWTNRRYAASTLQHYGLLCPFSSFPCFLYVRRPQAGPARRLYCRPHHHPLMKALTPVTFARCTVACRRRPELLGFLSQRPFHSELSRAWARLPFPTGPRRYGLPAVRVRTIPQTQGRPYALN